MVEAEVPEDEEDDEKLFTGMIAVIMIVAMLLTCIPWVPLKVFADTRIATMNGEDYWNFHSLVSDLNSKGGESVTIEMLRGLGS